MMTGLPFGEAKFDDARLHEREDVVIDLDAQVAAGDHDGVGGFDDGLEISQAALVFDLGDDAGLGAEMVEQRAQDQDVVAAADEGEGDEIDARGHADANVALVFFGEGGEIDVDAGQIDMPARAELFRA